MNSSAGREAVHVVEQVDAVHARDDDYDRHRDGK
jgi:hypothetical protein